MAKAPLIIAHRGASGYLPEHTLAAKALAQAQGADYLEQDVVASRDGQLIVCHDIYLDRLTDVATVHPGRARPDGRHYVIDFAWPELEALRVLGESKVPELAVGGPEWSVKAREPRMVTLDEELEFIRALNRVSGWDVGIYPEIKQPRWHIEHGFDLSRAVLHKLADHGYAKADGSVFVQCFDVAELKRVKSDLRSSLPLVQLIGRSIDPRRLSPAGLARVAEYAVALAPNYRQLLRAGPRGVETTPVTARARAAGLQLHPYTFNREDLPAYAKDLEQLLGLAYELIRPEAVFCDYPDVAVRVRAATRPHR